MIPSPSPSVKIQIFAGNFTWVNKAKHCWAMSTNFSAHNRMGWNPGYLLKYFLLYQVSYWKIQSVCKSDHKKKICKKALIPFDPWMSLNFCRGRTSLSNRSRRYYSHPSFGKQSSHQFGIIRSGKVGNRCCWWQICNSWRL